MDNYKPQGIEPKWQKKWEEAGLYQAVDFSSKPKKYLLIEFPYPSGERLHVGHGRSYCCVDMMARYYRMKGFNVLFPIGWDAFGLPAENYAIKTGINPSITTSENIKNAKKQAKSWGLSFDWRREINTTDPDYYQWTQWIFLKLLEKGLAYQDEVAVNWCPACRTNLADEEVLADGTHERCGVKTEKRLQKQWLLRITKYADRLLEDLNLVDYLPKIRKQQENWIGKKEGVEIEFEITGGDGGSAAKGGLGETGGTGGNGDGSNSTKRSGPPISPRKAVRVFTTRPETILGATFVVLSPNHKLANKVKTVINPATKSEIPVFVDEYVLDCVGTGAIMGVPAYDERDMVFAKEHSLAVVKAKFTDKNYGKKVVHYHLRDWVFSRQHYWGEPIPVIYCRKCLEQSTNNNQPTTMTTKVNGIDYAIIPVPEEDLPVKLPYVEKYEPAGTGESPLAGVKDWVKTKCPRCAGPARRETDTMPNWAGSNWYYLGYLVANSLGMQNSKIKRQNDNSKFKNYCSSDSENFSLRSKNIQDIFAANKDLLKYWLPVDLYNGGMEHTTLHLLYSRFIYKFLYDLGVVPTSEPYHSRRSHGVVLGPDGAKMSKSKGNIINPDEVVKTYDADTFRLYEAFMGPFDQMISWSDEGVEGCHRFLKRVFGLATSKINQSGRTSDRLLKKLNQTIKKVGSDLEMMKFNTAVASMMEFVNEWTKDEDGLAKSDLEKFLLILAPFAPHLSEELWQGLKGRGSLRSVTQFFPVQKGQIGDLPATLKSAFWSIHQQSWPKFESELLIGEKTIIIVEVNGKVREKLEVRSLPAGRQAGGEIEKLAKESEKVKKYLAGKKVKKVVFVADKLINFVTE